MGHTSRTSPSTASLPAVHKTLRVNRIALLAVVLIVGSVLAEDVVELSSGAKSRGTIVSLDDKEVVMTVKIGNQSLTRKYPRARVAAIVRNGKRQEFSATAMPAKPSPNSKPAVSGQSPSGDTRSRAEIDAEIAKVGKTPPDWFDSTPLNYPKTLDFNWPQPPQGGWNNQKNIGQFVWDVVNPNPTRWREGVRLMHEVLSTSKDAAVQRRAMNTLGSMYHNLLGDHARAAFWWRQAKADNSGENPGNAVHLAECYWRLGSKSMAVELLGKLTRGHPSMIKLWADMGETTKALQLAQAYAGSAPEIAWMESGDACRIAGRFDEALAFYEKVLKLPTTGQSKGRVERNQKRAEASIEAIRLFEQSDLKRVPDGRFTASSLGYEAAVEIEVTVTDHRITALRVTQHREKQFYSSISETPARIIAKQGVKGVDTTSGATWTSEAIINATAKALAKAK